MNFYTADSHFSLHDEYVIYRDFRPFESLEKMNEDKIKNVVSMAPFNDLETLIRDQVGTTIPRLANKIAKKYANIVCTNFKLTAEKNKNW